MRPPGTAVHPATLARGVQRPWDPRVWGTVIGAVGATVFVMSNRGALPEPLPIVAVIVWGLALVAYMVTVFVLPRAFGEATHPGARAGFVYLASVAGMLLLNGFGTLFLDGAGWGALRPSLTVVAVGLHFLPFALAFHVPMFIRLGALMAVIGSVGLALGWQWDERFGAAAAVVTGVVMLVVIAGDAWQGVRSPH